MASKASAVHYFEDFKGDVTFRPRWVELTKDKAVRRVEDNEATHSLMNEGWLPTLLGYIRLDNGVECAMPFATHPQFKG